ncbi:MAG: hypothetical protein ACAI44_10090 [Candidatus Sericytochromatia bacterium]
MHPKFWGLAALLLAGCQATTAPSPVRQQPLLLQEQPQASEPVVSVKSEVGPKSTGPKPTPVQDILQFFQTLNLDTAQDTPSLTTHVQLDQNPAQPTQAVRAVRFTLLASLESGERVILFSAQLNPSGDYAYSSTDLVTIQQALQKLTGIVKLEFEFYGPDPEVVTPITQVTPSFQERHQDDYVLELEIPDEHEDDFYEHDEHEQTADDDSGDERQLNDDGSDDSGSDDSDASEAESGSGGSEDGSDTSSDDEGSDGSTESKDSGSSDDSKDSEDSSSSDSDSSSDSSSSDDSGGRHGGDDH